MIYAILLTITIILLVISGICFIGCYIFDNENYLGVIWLITLILGVMVGATCGIIAIWQSFLGII